MTLVTLDDIGYEIAGRAIFRSSNLSLEPGERVCLVGRNGAGKSTLIKLITGELQADHGEIRYRQNLRISQLEQSLPRIANDTVYEHVAGGLAHLQILIDEYRKQSKTELDKHGLRELEGLQHRIEAEGGWNIDQRVTTVLTEMQLPAETPLADLSGGWQRRVGLARAIVSNPELLLLDEPTNHLDLATIQWLEDRVRNYPGCVLFVTHDRAFLQRIATRIVEIDRARVTSWPGNYHNFLKRREETLQAESKADSLFDKRLAEEETWIRQGLKARRTRNEGRVRALQSMREKVAQRLKPERKARIYIEEAEVSGRKVIELHEINHGFGCEKLINGLNLKVIRGDRIGLIGNNGVGKSTLLRIMLGQLEAQSGTVKQGTNLEIAYFDQMRRDLDGNKSVAEIVGEGRDYIKINGKDRHVIGYLTGFLFSAKRAMTKVAALSGGERNRLILAKLLAKPSNLLVLDEPTNDLDVETLEVLEERLIEYSGTLIVVSHDREFLDNVITSTLVFEDSTTINVYAGGYSDWLRKGRTLAEKDNPNQGKKSSDSSSADSKLGPEKKTKRSYKLQRELDALPEKIEMLESNVSELTNQISRPDFYSQEFEKVQPVLDELEQRRHELETAIARWSELESM